jgi:deoxyadenosine/deoxycytidine kinase
MSDRDLNYLVVEGPIGVGKTTLARRLAEALGSELLLEQVDDNPFLPQFYRDPRRHALPTQLCFLFQRLRQIESLRQNDLFRPAQIADFLIQKDEMFARVNLHGPELDLYYQVYNRLSLDAPVPDLVIYLQAPTDVLLKRIYARGHDYERHIDEIYLQRIADAYVEFFYHYDASPLLIVNSTDVDLARGEADFAALLKRVRQAAPGRHYLNPQAA